MLDSFLEAISRVGIFMICARAIVHFRPKEADEKYMKLLVSIMVLIQMFLPLGSFLFGGGERTAGLEQFKAELKQSVEEAKRGAAEADALLEQMTLEEVLRRMEEQRAAQIQSEAEGQSMTQEESTAQEQSVTGTGEQEAQEQIEIQVEPVERIRVGGEE